MVKYIKYFVTPCKVDLNFFASAAAWLFLFALFSPLFTGADDATTDDANANNAGAAVVADVCFFFCHRYSLF